MSLHRYLVKMEEGNYVTLMAKSYEDALQWTLKTLKGQRYPFNASRLTEGDRGVTESIHTHTEQSGK
jgi:hypothetical protein